MTWLQQQAIAIRHDRILRDIADDNEAAKSPFPLKGYRMDLLSISNVIKEMEPSFDTTLLLKINNQPLDIIQTGYAVRTLFEIRGFPTYNYNTAGASSKRLQHRTLRYDFRDIKEFAKMIIALANVNVFSYSVTGGDGGNLRLHVPFDATPRIFISSDDPTVWEYKYKKNIQLREAKEVAREREQEAYQAANLARWEEQREEKKREDAAVQALVDTTRALLSEKKERTTRDYSLDSELKRAIRLEDE